MKAKAQELLKLLKENNPSTATFLADHLHVSVRSIKNYVSEINLEYKDAVSSSNIGYTVNTEQINEILRTLQQEIPQSSKERQIYIINKLLKHNRFEEINIYDICDELYISYSTIKNDLAKVKNRLAKFDLTLNNKADFLSVSGLEKNKRKLLSSILYEESNVNFVNLVSLQKSFEDIDINFIKHAILETFDKYNYFINDYSLINLVLHLTIAVHRIKNENVNLQVTDNQFNQVKFHEYEMARSLAEYIGNKFDVKFNDCEIYELTLLIISRATNIDYSSINENNLTDFIGQETYDLVIKLIQDINAFYYIDLSESEFLVRFALHIRNLLIRSRNNYFNKNPLATSIKQSCPLIYDISVNAAQTIKSITGVSINDDEIAYIAFHLGSTIEAQKSLNEKITASLYCPHYYKMNTRLVEIINNYFGNELLITDVIGDESEIDSSTSDLILTTIPLSKIIAKPYYLLNPFLNEKDRDNLETKIKYLKKEKQCTIFKNRLSEMINDDLFQHKLRIGSQIECIKIMSRKLMDLNYVSEDFMDDILNREKMSSTGFNNFAIPHAMRMYANKTGINIMILDEPLKWGNTEVIIIMMMCFNRNERFIFNEIYEPITMIMSEPENVKKLSSAKNSHEFIELMTMML